MSHTNKPIGEEAQSKLDEYRKSIDNIDAAVINMLAERFKITQKVGPITLLLVYVLPFTPDDELTYIVAAGPIGMKRFILPILLGTLAKSAYSYIGDSGVDGILIATYARVVLLIVGLLVVGIQEYVVRKVRVNKNVGF